ncbi:MAG: hypothetical protein R3F14_33120 [Polyangiaceae bacterium]
MDNRRPIASFDSTTRGWSGEMASAMGKSLGADRPKATAAVTPNDASGMARRAMSESTSA